MHYQIQWQTRDAGQRGFLDPVFEDGDEADRAAKKAQQDDPGRIYWVAPAAVSRPLSS